jgi:hypothetical protein
MAPRPMTDDEINAILNADEDQEMTADEIAQRARNINHDR